MKGQNLLFAMCLSSLIAGCGGSGSGSTSGNGGGQTALYDGSYVSNSGSYGLMTLNVDTNGNVAGLMMPNAGATIPLSGSLTQSGTLTVSSSLGTMSGQIQGPGAFRQLTFTGGTSPVFFTAFQNPAAGLSTGVDNHSYAGHVINQIGAVETIIFTTDIQGGFAGSVDHFEGQSIVHATLAGVLQNNGAVTVQLTNPDGTHDSASGTVTISNQGKQVDGTLTSGTGHSLALHVTRFP
jgi:hypothetical protein